MRRLLLIILIFSVQLTAKSQNVDCDSGGRHGKHLPAQILIGKTCQEVWALMGLDVFKADSAYHAQGLGIYNAFPSFEYQGVCVTGNLVYESNSTSKVEKFKLKVVGQSFVLSDVTNYSKLGKEMMLSFGFNEKIKKTNSELSTTPAFDVSDTTFIKKHGNGNGYFEAIKTQQLPMYASRGLYEYYYDIFYREH